MAKAIKIAYKEIKARYEDNELKGTVETVIEETGEVISDEVNITTEIKELLSSLTEEDKIAINIKKFKPVAQKERKPVFKYHCGCEDSEIKSSCETLNVHCNECDEDFIKVVE